MKREFYLRDQHSNKFWTIERKSELCITTWGRVDAKPREKRTAFPTADAAQAAMTTQIAAKLAQGYIKRSIADSPPYEAPNWSGKAMSEEVLWELMSHFNWKRTVDDDEVMKRKADRRRARPAMPYLHHAAGSLSRRAS